MTLPVNSPFVFADPYTNHVYIYIISSIIMKTQYIDHFFNNT